MKWYQKFDEYLSLKLFRDVPSDLIREFEHTIRLRNAASVVILTWLCLFFMVVTLGLDILRYRAGLFFESPVYFLLFLSHLMFSLLILPLLIIRRRWGEMQSGEYPYTKKVIRYTIILTSIIFLPMTVLTILERGSVLIYGVYILMINFIILLPHRWRIRFNLFSFLAILLAIVVIYWKDIIPMAISVVEVLGITIPGFIISTFRYNDRVRRFLVDRRLKEQKKIIEEERKKSDRLLLNILPQEIARELKEKGQVAPKHYEQIVILFSDFKGFTELSRKLSATELVRELDACFTGFDQIMKRHNLEKIKTIGDGYLAIGGIEGEGDEAVLQMVRAGQEMIHFIEERKAVNAQNLRSGFDIRIGIHCGPVVAGVVGKSKFSFDIWGNTVNIASRMESAGAIGRINVSENVFQIIRSHYACTPRGEIEVKGIGKTQMYFVD